MKIRLLDKSEYVTEVVMETDGEVYFYDEADRYVFFWKWEEGLHYERVDDNCPVV